MFEIFVFRRKISSFFRFKQNGSKLSSASDPHAYVPLSPSVSAVSKKKNLKFSLDQSLAEQETMKRKRAQRFAKHIQQSNRFKPTKTESPQPPSVFSRIDKSRQTLDDDDDDEFYLSRTPEVSFFA